MIHYIPQIKNYKGLAVKMKDNSRIGTIDILEYQENIYHHQYFPLVTIKTLHPNSNVCTLLSFLNSLHLLKFPHINKISLINVKFGYDIKFKSFQIDTNDSHTRIKTPI